jgi:hypothetical protein
MQDAVNTVQFDLDTELEKLRLELREIRGAYKLESVDASHQASQWYCCCQVVEFSRNV